MSGIFGGSVEDRFHERELDRYLNRHDWCDLCHNTGEFYEPFDDMRERVRWCGDKVGGKEGAAVMRTLYRKWKRSGKLGPCPECK